MKVVYTAIVTTVKSPTGVGIDARLERLRLQFVATDMQLRLGRRIRARRRELGLTQKQLAKRHREEAIKAGKTEPGTDDQRVSDWERGENTPKAESLEWLVPALEVEDVGYFYGDDESGGDGESAAPDVMTALNGASSERIAAIEQHLEKLTATVSQLALAMDQLSEKVLVVAARRDIERVRRLIAEGNP